MVFTQLYKQCSRLMTEMVDISLLQHSLQEWIRKEIVDDDPYDKEQSIFTQIALVDRTKNRKDRLVSIQTKVLSLVSISESMKELAIREIKMNKAYKSVLVPHSSYQ